MEISNLSENQAIKLLGVITLTDGYLQINKKRCRWELVTIPNFELHKISKDLFEKAFKISISSFYKTKGKKYRSTEVSGKKYYLYLSKLKRITKDNFKFLSGESKTFKEFAFRLAMDLEGSISTKFCVKKKSYKNKLYYQFQFEPELKLSFTDTPKIENWIKISKDIGFKLTVNQDSRFESRMGGLRTSDKEQILKFYEIGGFATNGVISKSSSNNIVNNNDISKNEILKTILYIFKNNSDLCSKYFQSKNEADDYRKWFVQEIFLPTRNKI